MKKKTVNKPVKKADTLNELRKRDKKTIIVLVIATLIFFGVFFSIYSDDILNNSYEYFTQYDGEEVIEFEKGRVTEIVNEEKEIDEVAENAFLGNQELSVIVGSGRYKGETMLVHNYFGPYNGVPVEVGDMVTITIKTHSDGNHSATVYEINRIPVLAVFILLFFAIIIVVGGYAGLKSLIGLIITIICLFAILIPLLLKGAPPILTTFIICAYISMVCFTILGGVQRKSISAFLGTVAGTFFAMVFGIAVQYFSKIDGLRLDEAEALLQLKYAEVANISIRGLLSACIIICA
ncbi:MAG: YibE/F family protein, partial [Firmicutes bacterium]|nr:YibE/F family protein [Bacillota bacterium]